MESLYHLYISPEKQVINEEDVKNIYLYYCEGGLLPIFLRKLSGLIIFIFISVVIFILMDGISYSKLYEINEMKIKLNNQNESLIQYKNDIDHIIDFGIPRWYSIMYLIIVLVLIGIRIILLCRLIPLLLKMRNFYKYNFEIPDSSLHAISWDQIVLKISTCFEIDLAERLNGHGIRRSHESYNEVEITNIIMRYDNYMIGLAQYLRSIPMEQLKRMTSHFEETFIKCVFENLFNTPDGKELLKSIKSPSGENNNIENLELGYNNILLRQKLSKIVATNMRTMGIFRIIISPFIFVYMLIKFILEYGEKIYSDPKSIGSKIWTPFSKYRFRNYNELPHVFNHRLHKGEKSIIRYLNHISFSRLNPLYKLGIFLSGSIIIIILFLNLITNNQILSSKFSSINIVTWIAFLGLTIALFKSLLKKSSSDSPTKIIKYLNKISDHLLYIPSSWKRDPFSLSREKEISLYYNYQLNLSFFELLSPFTTPYKLIYLSSKSEEIINFMIEQTSYNQKVGYICRFSDFDHEPEICSSENIDIIHSNSRLEKSIIDFKKKHPNWKYH